MSFPARAQAGTAGLSGPLYAFAGDGRRDIGQFEYLALMAGCLVVTVPLEFVFAARVYRRPRTLGLAVLPVVVAFSIWDVIAIRRGNWHYNPQFVTGLTIPGPLPIEELVFFVVIPICGLLTYESVGTVLRRIRRARAAAPAGSPTGGDRA